MWAQLRQSILLLRLTPFEIDTAGGRELERNRRIVLSALASALAKSIGLVTMLATVPLTLPYLGPERYGLWMTISSVTALMTVADLGLGTGLLMAVARATGLNDEERIRRLVSSAFFLLGTLAATLGALFALVHPLVQWAQLFNVKGPAAVAECGTAIGIFVGCNLTLMPLAVAGHVRNGYQAGFAQSLWFAAENLLGLAGVLAATWLQAGLPWLVLATAAAPLLAGAGSTWTLFVRERPQLRPRRAHATAGAVRELLGTGSLFLYLNVAVLISQACDNFIIARVLGPAEVATFAVASRLFSLAPMALALAVAPLWPAYGEALARGDLDWVRKTLSRSLRLVLLVVGSTSLVLAVAGNEIARVWASPEIQLAPTLLWGLAAWSVLHGGLHTVSVFLNAAGVVRFQVIVAGVVAVAAFGIKLLLAPKLGTPGMVWGAVAAHSLCSVLPIALFIPSLLRRPTRLSADIGESRRHGSA